VKNPTHNILFPDEASDYFRHERAKSDFDYGVHEQLHVPKQKIYTSKATLDTVAGAKMHLPHGGQLVYVLANVQTGPVTNPLVWTLLKNGTSAFATSPTIAAGALYSNVTEFVDNGYFVPYDYFQVQVTTVSSAVGPMVVTIGYLAGYE
jgi:hypothetical protein